MSSYSNQRSIVLRRLNQGPTTIRDFLDLGISRFGARIWELRKQGFKIESTERRVNGSRHVTYWLMAGHSQALDTSNEDRPLGTPRNGSGAVFTPPGVCLECGKPLKAKQEKFCKSAHRTAHWKRQKNIRAIEAQQSLEFCNERVRSDREREDNFSTLLTGNPQSLRQEAKS